MAAFAPRHIPEEMKTAYTLNGRIPVFDYYINEVGNNKTIDWTDEYLRSFIDRFTADKIINEQTGNESYPYGSKFHLLAFMKHLRSIVDKKIAVVGSQTPWIESILVNLCAKEVVTVEYNVPICNHNIIRTISYDEFCKSAETYDVIVSYSSIEHSGLGRYGDSLNPNGDIEAMEQFHRHLNTDGLCFLGVPVGKDFLAWNAHRIYGDIRLNMLYLDGKFKELEWVGSDRNYIHNCPDTPGWEPHYVQPVIILRKQT